MMQRCKGISTSLLIHCFFGAKWWSQEGQLSAEEYLAYVRFEAEQCPAVVRAEVDSSQFTSKQTRYMPQVEEIPPCPEAFLPSSDWEQDVVVRFSKFRQHLDHLSKDVSTRERKEPVPPMKEESLWFKFCLGGDLEELDGSAREKAAKIEKISEELEGDITLQKNMLLSTLDTVEKEVFVDEGVPEDTSVHEENVTRDIDNGEQEHVNETTEYRSSVYPSNQLLLQFDQVLTQRLLGYISQWLLFPSLKIWETVIKASTDDCKNSEERYDLGERLCAWTFSLLSRLEKPLYMDTSATVRNIYRQLCVQRMELFHAVTSKTNSPRTDSSNNGSSAKRSMDTAQLSMNELPATAQKALALLNTIIVICGNYFGQQETLFTSKSSSCSEANHVTNERKFSTLVPVDDILYQDPHFGVNDDSYHLDGYGDY